MVDEFGQDLAVIGTITLDYHGESIVSGKYDFPADHHMTGMLYARVLGAPYAHAQITSIDTSKAEELEGVEAVINYSENPRWSDTILHWGQEVAAVAAVDEDTAERAIDLIDVVYDERPAVIDPEEAMQSGAPLVGAFPDSNITPSPQTLERGDVEAGFAQADVVIDEAVGWTAYYQHMQIEPDSCVAWWEGDDLYCWSTNQNPFGQLSGITNALQMPRNRVHVYTHGTGGGFGGKGGSYPEIAAALLSKKAGKPVALHKARRNQIIHNNHQYGVKAQIKMGCKNDGTLTAVELTFWSDGGSNGGRSGFDDVPQYTWNCPNFKSTTYGVATNKGRTGPWRCVQHPPGAFLSDIVLEKMAEKLGMNPLEFRRKMYVTEDMPDQDNGQPLSSNGVHQCLDAVAQAVGYSANYHAPGTKELPDGRLHGIGIHAHVDGHGSMFGARGAIINMCEDGTVLFNVGTSRCHNSLDAMGNIVAETVGVAADQVHVGDWGSTDTCSEGGMQAGSTSTISTGAAMKVAADDVRAQLFEIAATQLKVTPDELDARGGKIFVKADPTQSITHAQVMGKTGEPIIGRGVRWERNLRKEVSSFPVGNPCQIRGVCASACEVAVDPATGEVEITNFANAIDCGRAINLISAEAQVSVGMTIEHGQAMLYEQIHDHDSGALLTNGFLTHKLSTALDVPEDKNQRFVVETIDAVGPYGCKGMGEPAISSYVCVVNAVNNAIGKYVISAPLTPQKVLAALGKA